MIMIFIMSYCSLLLWAEIRLSCIFFFSAQEIEESSGDVVRIRKECRYGRCGVVCGLDDRERGKELGEGESELLGEGGIAFEAGAGEGGFDEAGVPE